MRMTKPNLQSKCLTINESLHEFGSKVNCIIGKISLNANVNVLSGTIKMITRFRGSVSTTPFNLPCYLFYFAHFENVSPNGVLYTGLVPVLMLFLPPHMHSSQYSTCVYFEVFVILVKKKKNILA